MKISALSRSDTRTEYRFNFQDLQILAEAANYIRSLAPYRIMPPLRNKDGSPNPADRRYLIDPKNQSMTEIEIGDYRDIQKHLKSLLINIMPLFLSLCWLLVHKNKK